MTLLGRVAVGAALVVIAGGCSAEPGSPSAADGSTDATGVADSSSPSSATATSTAATRAEPEPVDVASLPVGGPPRFLYLGGGVLRWKGRTVKTDFPADAIYLNILGVVDGRLVVTATQGKGSRSGARFWAIDASGHAERVGGTYRWYTYSPRLVESTGHLWVQDENRTTPRTIWEIDARTGRELGVWTHNREPTGLAPADQALVDGWVNRRNPVPDTNARSEDGELAAKTISVIGAGGGATAATAVHRTSDRSVVARFVLDPTSDDSYVWRVVFEDDDHILLLATVTESRRRGEQQAIVRCSVVEKTCERATDIDGSMALGVIGPLFDDRGLQ